MTTATMNVTITPALNVVTLVGRLGADPEVKYFESGAVVANLRLAVQRRRRQEDQPDWFDLEVWGTDADNAANYLSQGALIAIDGELKFNRWHDKTMGVARSKPVIRVHRIEYLSSKKQQTSDHLEDEL